MARPSAAARYAGKLAETEDKQRGNKMHITIN